MSVNNNELAVRSGDQIQIFPTERHLAQEILSHVDVKELITSCFSVCKQWSECLNNSSFWQNRASTITVGSIHDVIDKLLQTPLPSLPRMSVYEKNLMPLMSEQHANLYWELENFPRSYLVDLAVEAINLRPALEKKNAVSNNAANTSGL